MRSLPRVLTLIVSVGVSCVLATVARASNQMLSYSGRLTDQKGKPFDGPVDISVRFWSAASGGNQLGTTYDFPSTPLAQGVFQLSIVLKPQQLAQIFGDGTTTVFVEVTSEGKTYPRQQFLATPFALRVPTDARSLSYDSNGNLTLSLTSVPEEGQFLTRDGAGNLIWGTPSASATQLNNHAVSSQAPLPGQALVYDGTNWTPQNVASAGNGSGTNVTGIAPVYVSSGASQAVGITQASSISPGYVTASDYIALGNALSKSGGSMSGGLNMGANGLSNLAAPSAGSDAATKSYVDTGVAAYLKKDGSTALTGTWNIGAQDLTGIGNMTLSAAKTLGLGLHATDPSSLTAADKGKMWFNSTSAQVKYYDGTTVQTVGAAGAGITSINSSTGSAHTFATGSAGTAPAVVDSGATHTINIPLASAASVTAGLLGNADYATFSGKQPAGNYITALTGDISASGPGSVAATLTSTGVTAGSYAKVTVDAKGRVTAGSTLVAADLPALPASLVTGTLAVGNGGTGLATVPASNQILIGNGSTYGLSTIAGGLGMSISNSSGTLTIAATADASQMLRKDGTVALTGAWGVGSQDITGVGNFVLAPAKLLSLGTYGTDPSGLSASDKGKIWFNSVGNQMKYWDGAAVQALGVSGAGLTNLNGLTGSSQSFTVALTGTAPGVTSASTTHTFNIPMASSASVTAGLLSNADYAVFATKQGAGSYMTALTGDISAAGPNSAVATLASSGVVAGTYAKVTVDAKGRVTVGTTLSGTDLPPVAASLIAGTLSVGNGGTGTNSFTNNGVLLGNTSSNILSTAAGSAYQSLTVPSGGGTPAFSAVNLAQAAAVTGTLPVANGGTGLGAGLSGGLPYYSSTTAMSSSAALTSNGVLLGGGAGGAPTATAAGSAYQALRVPSGGGAPVFGALDLTQASAVTGALGYANGGIGTTSSPANGQLPIGNGTGFTLAGLTAGTGIGIVSASGSITINATADAANKVSKSGDTMTGGLNLGSNGVYATTYVAGSADASATPVSGTVRGANASGANLKGANLTLAAGNGTGSGGSGSINFQIALGSGTNSTANTLTTAMALSSTGALGLGVTAPAAHLEIADSANYQLRLGTGATNAANTYDMGRYTADGLFHMFGNQTGSNGYVFGGIDGERMRINADGNVGIGTNAPGANLSVKFPTNSVGAKFSDGNVVLGAYIDSSAGWFGTESNHPLNFYTRGHSLYDMTLDSGTLSIGQSLVVDDLGFNYGSTANWLHFGSSTSGEGIGSKRDSGGNQYGLDFFTGSLNRMSINADGNVGIGTVTPAERLVVVSAASADTKLEVSAAGDNFAGLRLRGDHSWLLQSTNAATGSLFRIADEASTTPRLAIDPAGNVGINSVLPDARLRVDGTGIFTDTLYVNALGTATGPGATGSIRLGDGTLTKANGGLWTFDTTVQPSNDAVADLGASAHRWNTIWASNGTISTSDRREKKAIADSDLGLDLIMRLRPVSYSWRRGPDVATVHYGLIAQETREAIAASKGVPLPEAPSIAESIVNYSKDADLYGINYGELIAPLIKAVQQQQERIEQDRVNQDQQMQALRDENTAVKASLLQLKTWVCGRDPAAPVCS